MNDCVPAVAMAVIVVGVIVPMFIWAVIWAK